MLLMEAPFSGGMGKAVLGGEVITGVLVLLTSLPLQLTNVKVQRINREFLTQRRKGVSDLFVEVILYCGRFVLFLGERFTGDSILTFNPPAEIDQLAPLRTEGTKGIVFPLDRLTAGWAIHES